MWRLAAGDFGFADAGNGVIRGKQRLTCEMTLRAGRCVGLECARRRGLQDTGTDVRSTAGSDQIIKPRSKTLRRDAENTQEVLVYSASREKCVGLYRSATQPTDLSAPPAARADCRRCSHQKQQRGSYQQRRGIIGLQSIKQALQ